MIKQLLAVVAVLLAVGAGYAMYELQRYHDSNENESSEMPGDIGAAPDFYVSDTALLKPGQRRIRERRDPALWSCPALADRFDCLISDDCVGFELDG
jgi:hypothetical protein